MGVTQLKNEVNDIASMIKATYPDIKDTLMKNYLGITLSVGYGIVVSVIMIYALLNAGDLEAEIDRLNKIHTDAITVTTDMYVENMDKITNEYEAKIKEAIKEERGRQANLLGKSDPFEPKFLLSKEQATRVLALAVYGESRGEQPLHMETIAWAIVNRVMDPRESAIYRNSVAGVVSAEEQYSSISPYLGVISNIVWGDKLDYAPKSARKAGTKDAAAWEAILEMVNQLYDGKLSRKTTANHFYSPSADTNNEFPSWVRYLKPVGVAGKHILYIDYIIKDGEYIYFTKDNPYNPREHG